MNQQPPVQPLGTQCPVNIDKNKQLNEFIKWVLKSKYFIGKSN